eukprot:1392478-Amorphochlora_amoeboformis.AAC.2
MSHEKRDEGICHRVMTGSDASEASRFISVKSGSGRHTTYAALFFSRGWLWNQKGSSSSYTPAHQ